MMTAARATLALLVAFAFAGLNFASAQTPSAPGAKVYFINLKDGQEVTSPFFVQFGLSGMAWHRPVSKNRTPGIIICSSTPRFRAMS